MLINAVLVPAELVTHLPQVLGAATRTAAFLVSATFVSLTPDPSSLPGGTVLKTLINGIGGWALLFSLAGLLIGAALWALGTHAQNYQQSFVGRRTVLVSAFAALLVGAGPELVRFFYSTGGKVR